MTASPHVFVVGRFSPLHHGHLHLLDAACACGGTVYVLSYASPSAPGCDAQARLSWLLEAARTRPRIAAVEVRSGPLVPPDSAPAAHHRAYCAAVIQALGWPINHVASSESYGPGLAAALTLQLGRPIAHTSVDPERDTVPISATQIRANPLAHQNRLEPTVLHTYLDARLRGPGTPPPMPGPHEALAGTGVSRADLYDTFLGRHVEAPHVVAFLRRAGIQPPARVLDAGCGTGRLLCALAKKGYRPMGLDPDADYLERARSAGVPVYSGTFADAGQLPVPFDAVVVANGPLVYLLQPEQRIAALRALASVLRPGGLLVVDVPHLHWIYNTTYSTPTPRTMQIGAATVTRYPTHRIHADAGLWHHTDHHKVELPHRTTAWCAESFVFAMLTRSQLTTELQAAGLCAEAWWSGWTARHSGGPNGPRLLVTARVQGTTESPP